MRLTRRQLQFVAGASVLLAAVRAAALPRYKVSAAQLDRTLAERFPVRYPVAGGMVDLAIQQPLVRFMQPENRLGTLFSIEATSPALRRPYAGQMDIDFALRYEPSDQTIRAHQLQLRGVRLPGLEPGLVQLLAGYLPALFSKSMGEVVLHRLHGRELGLADVLGLQPDTITVVGDGILIGFARRASGGNITPDLPP